MDFFKKNLIFSVAIVVCLLTFLFVQNTLFARGGGPDRPGDLTGRKHGHPKAGHEAMCALHRGGYQVFALHLPGRTDHNRALCVGLGSCKGKLEARVLLGARAHTPLLLSVWADAPAQRLSWASRAGLHVLPRQAQPSART